MKTVTYEKTHSMRTVLNHLQKIQEVIELGFPLEFDSIDAETEKKRVIKLAPNQEILDIINKYRATKVVVALIPYVKQLAKTCRKTEVTIPEDLHNSIIAIILDFAKFGKFVEESLNPEVKAFSMVAEKRQLEKRLSSIGEAEKEVEVSSHRHYLRRTKRDSSLSVYNRKWYSYLRRATELDTDGSYLTGIVMH